MSVNLDYTMVDGIECYSPEVVSAYTDYPDSRFDLTDRNAETSFWVKIKEPSVQKTCSADIFQ